MGILVNIITAAEDEIEAIIASQHPVEEWTGIEAREIDAAKLATLHCLLIDDTFEDALADYERAYALGEEEGVVLRIPDELTRKLAVFDEEALEQVGEELAATEEFEVTGWPAEEVKFLVLQLGDLARMAVSQGQVLFVWMHPLNT